jgi:hypothetical protein
MPAHCNAWSNGLVIAPFLECGKPIAESYPRHVVTQPRMMGRRKRAGIIEAARRDVHCRWGIVVRIGQWRATRSAKAPEHGCGRPKFRRMTLQKFKLGLRKGHPRDDRCRSDAPARSTMADHGVARPTSHAVPDGSAHAPTRDVFGHDLQRASSCHASVSWHAKPTANPSVRIQGSANMYAKACTTRAQK